MATDIGANIVGNDLIFGLDSGYGVADNSTATRFYPGEPTVNYVSDSPSQGGWSGGIDVLDSSQKKFKCHISNFNGNPRPGWRSFTWNMNAHSGSDVTISLDFETVGPNGTMAWIMVGQTNTHTSNNSGAGQYMGYSATSERTQKTTTSKERVTWTGTIGSTGTANQPSGHIGFTFWINNGVPSNQDAYIIVSNVQIEKKDHATPFVNGTRSNTASLIDLKKTRSINISGASFDSTGQPVFDGTDDVVSLGTNFNLNNKSFSVESIIKWDGGSEDTFFSYKDSAGGTQKDIHWRIYTTGQLRFDFYSNSINSSTGSIVAGEYVHLVTTYNFGSDSCICYKNGEVLMSGSAGPFLGNDTNSTAYVGAWGTTQYFGGKIPILKMYNSAISATEIKQNYNAYKKRFDL